MSKSILTTGCSTGFGSDMTKLLARNGHHVFATLRNVAGLDFGPKATNELNEPVRLAALETMQTSDWDGPKKA